MSSSKNQYLENRNIEDQTITSITSENRKQLLTCNQIFLIFHKDNFSKCI